MTGADALATYRFYLRIRSFCERMFRILAPFLVVVLIIATWFFCWAAEWQISYDDEDVLILIIICIFGTLVAIGALLVVFPDGHPREEAVARSVALGIAPAFIISAGIELLINGYMLPTHAGMVRIVEDGSVRYENGELVPRGIFTVKSIELPLNDLTMSAFGSRPSYRQVEFKAYLLPGSDLDNTLKRISSGRSLTSLEEVLKEEIKVAVVGTLQGLRESNKALPLPGEEIPIALPWVRRVVVSSLLF